MVSVFGESYKSSLIFCKKCNTHPYDYYKEEQFLKTREDAIYAHHMIKDVIMPKFLAFLFEGKMNKDGFYIDGYKTLPLIEPETIIKGIKYNLVGGICSPTKIHFKAFLYNYQKNLLKLQKCKNYYLMVWNLIEEL